MSALSAEAREPDARVFAELWISFVALIRSYVAAHDLARPISNHAFVEDGADRRMTLRSENKTLGLEFDATIGAGSWVIYEDDPGPERVLERGSFNIGQDSRVALSDRAGKLDLEVAAEAFTAKVFNEE